jgi:hypothetical protein
MLRLSEDAARMRTKRGLEKLQQMLARKGVSSPAVAVAGLLSAHAVASVPASFVSTISASAVVFGGSGAGIGSLLSVLAMNQLKILGVLAIGGLATCLVELQSNRAPARTLADVQTQNQAETDLADEMRRVAAQRSQASVGNPNAAELANASARLVQLKARPPGVTDEALKPAAAWRNQGRATPEAVIETLLWAATSGDADELPRASMFEAKWQPLLDGWFKTLSPAVQARSGTPERLLAGKIGEFLASGSGGDATQRAERNAVRVRGR